MRTPLPDIRDWLISLTFVLSRLTRASMWKEARWYLPCDRIREAQLSIGPRGGCIAIFESYPGAPPLRRWMRSIACDPNWVVMAPMQTFAPQGAAYDG